MTRLLLPPLLLLALAGCATAPPSNPENICAIFREKPDWHDAALKVQKKWGAPVPVPMAMMYQESSFKHDAVPPRYYFLGFIPGPRQFRLRLRPGQGRDLGRLQERCGRLGFQPRRLRRRAGFHGLVHEQDPAHQRRVQVRRLWPIPELPRGWTGYRNRSYDRKAWLKTVSQKVQARAQKFAAQYKSCESDLTRGGWFW